MQAVSGAKADSNMPKLRLGPEDWVMAGFRALAADGPQAVRAETLARGLGATKGSFYWHFKDLAALHQAMRNRPVATAVTGP